jgi:hypothetical protein
MRKHKNFLILTLLSIQIGYRGVWYSVMVERFKVFPVALSLRPPTREWGISLKLYYKLVLSQHCYYD